MSELTAQLSQLDIESIEVISSPVRKELSLEDLMAKGIESGSPAPRGGDISAVVNPCNCSSCGSSSCLGGCGVCCIVTCGSSACVTACSGCAECAS